jgi:nucleoside phosphorylase
MASLLNYDDYTIGWICALRVEVLAARFMLDSKHDGVFPAKFGDDNDYIPGTINGHNVVIVGLPQKSTGTVSAASLVQSLVTSFPNIRHGLMVGIGAGVPGKDLDPDIRLGDVVVAAPGDGSNDAQGVVGYELGKETVNGFVKTGWLYPTDRRLRNAIQRIEVEAEYSGKNIFTANLEAYKATTGRKFLHPGSESDLLYEAEKVDGQATLELISRSPRESPDPVVHYGLIASGDKLMKNARLRDELRDRFGIICFEMEAAGLMNTLPVAVIRGVCDYADAYKNDKFHHYAAATAAAYAKGLLQIIGADPSKNPQPRSSAGEFVFT